MLCLILPGYPIEIITKALLLTGVVTATMVLLGLVAPQVFLGLGRTLFIALFVGLIAEVSQNYKGADPEGGSMDRWFKSREIYNTQKISVEAYTRIGWKAFAVFYGVHITKLFNDGIGPSVFPMSVGLSISLF